MGLYQIQPFYKNSLKKNFPVKNRKNIFYYFLKADCVPILGFLAAGSVPLYPGGGGPLKPGGGGPFCPVGGGGSLNPGGGGPSELGTSGTLKSFCSSCDWKKLYMYYYLQCMKYLMYNAMNKSFCNRYCTHQEKQIIMQ